MGSFLQDQDKDFLLKIRRHLHQYPELSSKEFKTCEYLAHHLRSFGLEVHFVAKTGLVAILRGNKEKPCIALRSDLDALPIVEDTSLEFKSCHPGVMHACGHDAHMSILLTTAKILSTRRQSLNGTVKFIFQPAEEAGGGADLMIQEGVLEEKVGGVAVDEVYGLHIWSLLKTGRVALKEGPFMAGCKTIEIDVKGKGGHAAEPQNSRDAVLISTHLVQALQTVISRNIDPFDAAVLTIGQIESGFAENVIADHAKIQGTIRFFSQTVEERLTERLEKICQGVGTSFDSEITLNFFEPSPAVINRSERCFENVKRAVHKVVGLEGIDSNLMTMGSEDFSSYLQKKEGCFFFVGCAPEPFDENNPPAPHHRPSFVINEDCLQIGTSIFCSLITDLLE